MSELIHLPFARQRHRCSLHVVDRGSYICCTKSAMFIVGLDWQLRSDMLSQGLANVSSSRSRAAQFTNVADGQQHAMFFLFSTMCNDRYRSQIVHVDDCGVTLASAVNPCSPALPHARSSHPHRNELMKVNLLEILADGEHTYLQQRTGHWIVRA